MLCCYGYVSCQGTSRHALAKILGLLAFYSNAKGVALHALKWHLVVDCALEHPRMRDVALSGNW